MTKPRSTTRPRSATITDVARAARVSVASVSRVVNGHANVLPRTRARIAKVIEQLRYVPNTAARSLIRQQTQSIGVLLPDLYGGFFSELIRGIDGAARAHKLQLLLSSSHGDAREMAAAIRAMHGRVEGLLVLAPQLTARDLDGLAADVPTVFMNSPVTDRPALAIDSYGGARAMVRHLIGRGHRTITHISGPTDNFDAHERERGYRDELASALPRARPVVLRGDFTEASGYAAGREIARGARRPAAVFAANDGMAIGCLAAFDSCGLAVPRDLAVAGFDDIPLAAYVRPPLTTMRVPIVELGRGAVSQLLAALAAHTTPTTRTLTPPLAPTLVVRESCGIDNAVSPKHAPVSVEGHDAGGHDDSRPQHGISRPHHRKRPRRKP
ncbi:MAG TPA: LacI family DNA-binding transcriptional regulator [Kofleriaceae bacterium]|nr:LacI family DNA-binding transcriptional regulator [Kofleriaceae bacterium]